MEKTYKLQFYADKKGNYSNKLFSFFIKNFNDCFRLMLHFRSAGNHFRSAYFVTITELDLKGDHGILDLSTYVSFFNTYLCDRNSTLEQAKKDYQIYIF
jgi:hypothetical protein